MPIFIDEVVFRGEVVATGAGAPASDPGSGPARAGGVGREALVAEVAQMVIDHLERALERIGER